MDRFSGSVEREYKGQTIKLVMDFNAAVFFEEQTGLEFFSVVENWGDDGAMPPVRHLRQLVHAALQEHHPDLTLADAGKILSDDVKVVTALSTTAAKGSEDAADGKKSEATQ